MLTSTETCEGNIGYLPVMAASSAGVALTSRARAACLKPSPSWKQGCSRSALARLSCNSKGTCENKLDKLFGACACTAVDCQN